MRLSNVLELKKIFEKYPGSEKVKIDFKNNNQSKVSLLIDSSYGISIENNLIKELESLSYYHSVFVIE